LLSAAPLLPVCRVPAQPASARGPFPQQLSGVREMTATLPGKPVHQRGTLLLESQQTDRRWPRFAAYPLRRPQATATAAPAR
jgi:hypothetical protein